MGLGFKDFTAGDVLTAAQVDGYLMRQTTMVFASTSARDTALSGNLEEGMFCYTTDTDSVWYYNGSAWKRYATPWTAYTPSWTNLTLGNGTQSASYKYEPAGLWVRGSLTFGTTTSISGNVEQTVPNSETPASSGGNGLGMVFASNGTNEYSGVVRVSSTTMFFYANANQITATNPITWANTHILGWNVFVPLD